MTSKRCQRAICGAKNFFKADIYLKWWNYFLATVEDEFDFLPIICIVAA